MKFEAEGQEWGRGSWKGAATSKLAAGFVRGRALTPLDALRAQKTHLVVLAANIV